MKGQPDQLWWTATELAEANLPGLPTSKRRVNALAKRSDWASLREFVRRRSGKGGGIEYHWSLLPDRAKLSLLAERSATPKPPAETPDRDAAWEAYEALSDAHKVKAQNRLEVIQTIDQLRACELSSSEAVTQASRLHGVSPRSIWTWLGMIEGVRGDDRLAYLVPKRRGGAAQLKSTAVPPEFAALVRDDFLRLEKPSLTSCYERAERVAKAQNLETAPIHSIRRWIKATVSSPTMTLRREGLEALKRLYPAQTRDKSAMHAMEAVNGDFHRFDVFVQFPGIDTPVRPQMVAFQDVYSGRLVSWRVDTSANSHAVQLCIGDMVRDWGIPEHVLLDNGREFAAKAITGGAPTRFRFQVREDDIPGLLVSLGCEIHWATPYSGQSKPIERAFRDLCDRVAKHPAFAGAYTGNKPEAKPENYGSRAIPLADFLKVLAVEIEAHNLRRGRRSEVAYGRSFVEVFDESYATAPIRKATDEQSRLWLMGAEGVRAQPKNGQINFMGNSYWEPWMYRIAGEKIVARFDKAALHDGLHVYDIRGAYLGHAGCTNTAGFFDIDGAREHSRLRSNWLKSEKAAAEADRKFTAAQLGERLADATPDATDPIEAKVVRAVFNTPANTPDQRRSDGPPARTADEEATIADLTARLNARQDSGIPEETELDRFERSLALETAIADGQSVAEQQRLWLERYQQSAEYSAHKRLHETFGAEMFGDRGT